MYLEPYSKSDLIKIFILNIITKEDFNEIGEDLVEEEVKKDQRRNINDEWKIKWTNWSLNYFHERQGRKTSDIKYNKLKMQGYLASPMFSNTQCVTLVRLRSRTTSHKRNMPSFFQRTKWSVPWSVKTHVQKTHKNVFSHVKSSLTIQKPWRSSWWLNMMIFVVHLSNRRKCPCDTCNCGKPEKVCWQTCE